MKRALMSHEFTLMLYSQKNLLYIFFLLAGICIYIFVILPGEETNESFDPEQTYNELHQLNANQEAREERRGTGFSGMLNRSIFVDNDYAYKLKTGMVHAFQDTDYRRFTYLRTHYLHSLRNNLIRDNSLYPEDSPSPVKDGRHYMDKKLLFYEHLLKSNTSITYSTIEEKTALQVFKKGLLTIIPILMVFSAIYFSNDVLVRNLRQTTTLQGLPVSWYVQINSKSITAFFYTVIMLTGLIVIGMGLLTMKNGFGSFEIPVAIFKGLLNPVEYEYGVMSLLTFFSLSFVFALVFIWMFIRFNMILSLLLKNEWIVLLLSTLVLFSERMYFARDKRKLFGEDISIYPQTYFDFGKVITGEKNFLVNLETITLTKGLTVVLITLVVIEVIVFILTRMINRRRFYHA